MPGIRNGGAGATSPRAAFDLDKLADGSGLGTVRFAIPAILAEDVLDRTFRDLDAAAEEARLAFWSALAIPAAEPAPVTPEPPPEVLTWEDDGGPAPPEPDPVATGQTVWGLPVVAVQGLPPAAGIEFGNWADAVRPSVRVITGGPTIIEASGLSREATPEEERQIADTILFGGPRRDPPLPLALRAMALEESEWAALSRMAEAGTLPAVRNRSVMDSGLPRPIPSQTTVPDGTPIVPPGTVPPSTETTAGPDK